MRGLGIGALGLLVGPACDSKVHTEREQVVLSSNVWFESGDAILERSRVCLDYHARRIGDDLVEAEETEIAACYEEHIDGSAAVDAEGCLLLGTPGHVTWRIDRQPCDLDGDFGDDRVRFDVLRLEEVRGAFSYAVPMPDEIQGIPIENEPSPPPDGFVAAVGEPIRVIEGQIESISTTVVRGDPVAEVTATDARVTAMPLAGAPTLEAGEGWLLAFEARAGDVFAVMLELAGGELDVGEVHVVARDEIASVEWLPTVVRVTGTDFFLGIGALAVARDARGRVLRGTPATWSVVDGDFELDTFDSDEDGTPDPEDYAFLTGTCEGVRAGTRQAATIEGRVDEFAGVVDVEWTCVEDHVADGCGCNGAPAPGWAILIAPLVAFRRRRPLESAAGVPSPR